MPFAPASTPSLVAFLSIVTAVLVAVVGGVAVAYRRAGQAPTRPTIVATSTIAAWLGVVSAVVASGAVAARPMPLVPLVVSASVALGIAFRLSPFGRRLATLPLFALVAFQAFRLPLELVLHAWARGGTIPETMTWSGQNFDVIAGALALLAAPIVWLDPSPRRRRALAWAVDVVGIALLANVVRVAAMSSPLPFAWHVEPPFRLLMHLPYAWIAPACVGGAAAGHVVLTRSLLKRPADEGASH